MADDGRTVGIWVGEETEIVDEFDEYFSRSLGAEYSRSNEIKNAMALYLAVCKTYEQVGYDFEAQPPMRHTTLQAIRDMARND